MNRLSITQPANLKINLYKHQMVSVYEMEQLEKYQKITYDLGNYKTTQLGINADPTGYGKTLSMITLVLRDKMEWDLDTPYIHQKISIDSGGLVKNYINKEYTKLNCTLALMSTSIISQWRRELKYTNLRVGVVSKKRDVDSVYPENYDIILITPTMYNFYISSTIDYAWKRFIFDEPSQLRIAGMKSIKAGFYWFISATPNGITENHKNCRNSFMKEIVSCDYWYTDFETKFAPMIIKNDFNFVRISFEMPPTYNYYYQCYQPLFNVINGFVSHNITLMIEAGDIQSAILALGGKQTENIHELVKRKKLEEKEEIESKIRIYEIRGDVDRINVWKTRLDHINIQINE